MLAENSERVRLYDDDALADCAPDDECMVVVVVVLLPLPPPLPFTLPRGLRRKLGGGETM